jgi:DNA repair protein RadC
VLIMAMPSHERPRERLMARGPDALTERELLALVLRNGTNGVNALDLAGEILAEYGNLRVLAAARPEELARCRGLGPAKAAAIVAAFALARRAEYDAESTAIRRPDDVAVLARRELEGVRRERLVVLVCDAANRVRRVVAVSEGSIDRSLVPVREILNAVLRHDGRAFALAHNHPSGDPEPSDSDRRATENVRDAAKVAGLRFLGHIVVTDDDWREVS